MEKLDFQSFKQSLSETQIIQIVEDLGGSHNERLDTSKYLVFSSFLYHVGDAELHKFKLYYYIESCQFMDYKMGESFDIFELVQRAKELYDEVDMNPVQAYKWICGDLGISSKIQLESNTYNYLLDIGRYANKYIEKEATYYDESILNMFPKLYHQSWIDDNISIDTMKKFNIRYYLGENEIVIPCYDIEHRLTGIRARNVDPRRDWKYMPLMLLDGTQYKFPTANFLYGLDKNANNIRKSKKVILCESEKSVLQADGYVKEGQNIVVGLFGSAFTKEKLNQLLALGVDEIIIGYDFDYEEIGNNQMWNKFEEKVLKTADLIRPYCHVSAMVDYEQHKLKSSPTDMGKQKFFRLFTDREDDF